MFSDNKEIDWDSLSIKEYQSRYRQDIIKVLVSLLIEVLLRVFPNNKVVD